ncbi:ABC transporter ATP-binding protein [Agrococcus versicolor]|uniref:ABC transporter ATP-binding protein n=1 Tax=Agrococcus versicolor TaxID=501482 RepID=A0ABN3AWC9_9MICO
MPPEETTPSPPRSSPDEPGRPGQSPPRATTDQPHRPDPSPAPVAREPRWHAPAEAATAPVGAQSQASAHPQASAGSASIPNPTAPSTDHAGSPTHAPTSSATAGIEVVDVRRAFGSVQAVRSMTFTAAPGSVTALIGPNGAGKTTLLLMLASLLAPDAGSIRIGGVDPIADPRVARRVLGWMPDVLGTWRTLSPRVVLRMMGRLHGMPTHVARARADELVAVVGLEQLADRPSRVLSRGQQQRLGLARALVHRPRVLLLDEPAAGLDPASRVQLRGLLRDLATDGCTVLVSSHDLGELDEVADASVFVEAGEAVSGDRLASARGSSTTWRIRSLDPAALSLALGRIGVAIDRIRVEGPSTTVVIDADAHAADLLARLVAAGVPIVHFAPTVGDIERTFLGLSGQTGAPGLPAPGRVQQRGGVR